MSNIKDDVGARRAHDIALINRKRLVVIVDEAHRSTFGRYAAHHQGNLPRRHFLRLHGHAHPCGKSKENEHHIHGFGNELHRYSIADGIHDRNVLGFDPCMVTTFRDSDVRLAVALHKAKAKHRAGVG